jgi:hypothetical protein
MPTVWFCCQCGDGPHNPDIATHCPGTNCNHYKCSGCSTQTTDSDDMDSASECSDDGWGIPPFQKTMSTEAHTSYGYTLSSTSKPNPTIMGFPESAPGSTYTHDSTMPINEATPAFLDYAQPIPTTYTPGKQAPAAVEYVWYCCGCGDGPHSAEYCGACTHCNRWRCGNCQVQTKPPPGK